MLDRFCIAFRWYAFALLFPAQGLLIWLACTTANRIVDMAAIFGIGCLAIAIGELGGA